MNFYLGEYSEFPRIPINCLCVSTTNNIPGYFSGVNTVDCTIDGIFNNIENFNEENYFNNVNIKMRKAGHNGFMEYITHVINNLSRYNYHDKNDKVIIFDSVAFLSDKKDDNHLLALEKIFVNFGFSLLRFKSGNQKITSLF